MKAEVQANFGVFKLNWCASNGSSHEPLGIGLKCHQGHKYGESNEAKLILNIQVLMMNS